MGQTPNMMDKSRFDVFFSCQFIFFSSLIHIDDADSILNSDHGHTFAIYVITHLLIHLTFQNSMTKNHFPIKEI